MWLFAVISQWRAATVGALRSEVALRQARGVGAVRGEAVSTEANHRGHGDNQDEDSKDCSGHHARNERIAPPPRLEARRDLRATDWIDPGQLHSAILTLRMHAPILAGPHGLVKILWYSPLPLHTRQYNPIISSPALVPGWKSRSLPG